MADFDKVLVAHRFGRSRHLYDLPTAGRVRVIVREGRHPYEFSELDPDMPHRPFIPPYAKVGRTVR
jgi:hypothetical protein